MSNKPKVLIIENSIDVTGALKSILISACVIQNNFEILFVIPQNSKAKPFIESKGFKTCELPMKELRRSLISILQYIPYLIVNTYRLKEIIKENAISIIHGNDIYNLLPAVNRLTGDKTPYVCHIRFMPDKFPAWLMSFWFKLHQRFSHAIIAVSKSVASQLPNSHKVMVIYDSLPLEEQSTRSTNKKEHFTFLYLSNFMEGKGHNLAVKAFSKIHDKLPDWKLRFVGGEMGLAKNIRYRQALEEKTKRLGIYSKTEWMEFTNDVEKEYKEADIVLNFSESESFSMTCLEALFFGRPLIASDCGGPTEILEGGQIGILVQNRNISAMAGAMEELARNAVKRDQMGALAGWSIREKFSEENTTNRLKVLYSKMLVK